MEKITFLVVFVLTVSIGMANTSLTPIVMDSTSVGVNNQESEEIPNAQDATEQSQGNQGTDETHGNQGTTEQSQGNQGTDETHGNQSTTKQSQGNQGTDEANGNQGNKATKSNKNTQSNKTTQSNHATIDPQSKQKSVEAPVVVVKETQVEATKEESLTEAPTEEAVTEETPVEAPIEEPEEPKSIIDTLYKWLNENKKQASFCFIVGVLLIVWLLLYTRQWKQYISVDKKKFKVLQKGKNLVKGLKACPDGEFQLEDGSIVIVKEKLIDSIVIKQKEKEKKAIKILDENNESFTITLNGEEPTAGDNACPDGEYIQSGKQYIIEGGILKEIKSISITELRTELDTANKRIQKIHTEIVEACQKEREKVENEYQRKIEDLNSQLTNLNNENNQLRRANGQLQIDNSKLTKTNDKLQIDIAGLIETINRKDNHISQLLEEIKKLAQRLARISRQNLYLLQIDDVLKDVSVQIPNAFADVEEGDFKSKLISPLLNGVTGLDAGVTSFHDCWQQRVMQNPKEFFGKDIYEMSDDEVKKKLVTDFLKNFVQGDTVSKLTRLYLYIQVNWINEILIQNHVKVVEIERIFNRFKTLLNDFGIELIYPRLFVDRMDNQKYTFDPRNEVFRLFPLNDEKRQTYIKQSDVIIDIIQIGIRIPSEQYTRKPIVSIPNF